ncbi:MAG: DUF692 family protein [Candidatus Peregrinibacteria bacterium]|nr:DUF692 family protein [Candidatus Peregrinibacteria bacterium]
MKLALNYSPQALELLEEEQIDIDVIKCSDQPDLIEKAQRLKPTYVHFPLNAGTQGFSPDWQRIEEVLKTTATRFINLHLEATSEDYPDIPITSQDEDHESRIMEKMIEDVQEVSSRFGAENVILENDPYHAEARASFRLLRLSAEPWVISEIIRQTGCGLLLDIDHARVSSHYMGITLEYYIAQLPTHRLKELHMTGTRPHQQEGWFESHHEMRQEDWLAFDWALGQIQNGSWANPNVYAFEYGGVGEKFDWRSDKAMIAEQVPLFRKKITVLV